MEFENDVRISFSPGSHVTVVHPPALGIAIGLTAGFILGFVLGWFLGRRDPPYRDRDTTNTRHAACS